MAASAVPFSEPDSFKRFLRRCGNTFCAASVAIGPDDAASVELAGFVEVSLAGWEMEALDGVSELAEAKDERNPPFNPVAS